MAKLKSIIWKIVEAARESHELRSKYRYRRMA